jgi:serine/threonine protein kinase
MNAGTEPVRRQQPRTGTEGATLAWLDALASNQCTAEVFLVAMREQFQGNREGTWEAISLLDQYYRRGKIDLETFRLLKSRLEDSALGRNQEAATSLRPSAATVAVTATVTAPAAASHAVPPTVSHAVPPTVSHAESYSVPPGVPHTVSHAVRQEPTPPISRAPVREVAIGDVLRGRYKIQGVLGHGGMGTVFEAIDTYRLDLLTSDQRIAIKVLHTAVTERDELLSELQREFQNLQLLSHPNVVRVHEFDRDGDLAFFTMELLNGALLSRVLSTRNAAALPRQYALAIIRDVAAALSHAHWRGVVHGDVNPQNIFIINDGELRVLDFGASHILQRDMWSTDHNLPHRAPVATPGYASCQVLEGQRPDARDDIFAFACVTYLLLSGKHPFPRRTALEARAQHLRPSRPPGLTSQQWRALRDGLRWERERRPTDVRKWAERFELGTAVARLPTLPILVNAPPPRKRRPVLAAAALLLFALLATGGYWMLTDYDSVVRNVSAWSAQVKSAVDGAGALPDTRVAGPQTPPPAASGAAPAPRANSKPSPAPLAQTPSTPGPRAAALTPPSHMETPARPANSSPVQVEMAADTVDVDAADSTAHITVRRKGNLHGEASFTWWTESGTAKPVQDFVPVTPRVESIEDGRASVSLSIPVSEKPRNQARSFYVVIDQSESGAALGARTLTMVTLLPTD